MEIDYLALTICGIIALVSAIASIKSLMAARIIEDTPTSKIRSAHQGYVELIGFAKIGPEPLLLSGLSKTPCLWFRYNIERYESSGKNSSWRSIEKHTSTQAFTLNDGSGDCYVMPSRADVSTQRKRTWHGNSRHPSRTSGMNLFGKRYRYTEEMLCADDLLYIIGLFETRHPPNPNAARDAEMAKVLNEWKQDYDKLTARFDRNGDGEIDLQEWELARAEALRKAERNVSKQAPLNPVHTISYSPSRRQPYIIASSEPESLSKRYRWQAVGMLLVSLGSATALAWLIVQQ
ncbi:E3 ubiquitin ligase family protein [Zhongshania aquimaris]|uniref:RING-type E3 ubiquitin transferase n=1 Tax=Zhongshania aquimaris TaxID=2857107 RepID=A0ABS6VU88_9GAMM|nr:E3 ubiquitin ligase family protein [Zhongshania aquimaris]MBW2941886.1 E3 ubiquitin ligase family protein [Zhongshania aquimaris]